MSSIISQDFFFEESPFVFPLGDFSNLREDIWLRFRCSLASISQISENEIAPGTDMLEELGILNNSGIDELLDVIEQLESEFDILLYADDFCYQIVFFFSECKSEKKPAFAGDLALIIQKICEDFDV